MTIDDKTSARTSNPCNIPPETDLKTGTVHVCTLGDGTRILCRGDLLILWRDGIQASMTGKQWLDRVSDETPDGPAALRRYIHQQLGFLTDDDNRPAEGLIRLAVQRLGATQETEARHCQFCELPAGHEGPHERSISKVLNAQKTTASDELNGESNPRARASAGQPSLAVAPSEKASEVRERQCSWGCHYVGDRFIRYGACTVHGGSSENGDGEQNG